MTVVRRKWALLQLRDTAEGNRVLQKTEVSPKCFLLVFLSECVAAVEHKVVYLKDINQFFGCLAQCIEHKRDSSYDVFLLTKKRNIFVEFMCMWWSENKPRKLRF